MRRRKSLGLAFAGLAVLMQSAPALPDDGGGRVSNVLVPLAGTVAGCSETVAVSGVLNVQLRQRAPEIPPGPPNFPPGPPTRSLSVRAELGDFSAIGQTSGAAYGADGEIRFRMMPPGPPAAPSFTSSFVIPFTPPNPCVSASLPSLPINISLAFNADGSVQFVTATVGEAATFVSGGG